MTTVRTQFPDRVEYRLNGNLHREDGPAIERSNGTKYWYLNGKFHRTNGPAVEQAGGGKEWWIGGKLHRTGGPAIEIEYKEWWKDEWWINHKEVSKQEVDKLRCQLFQKALIVNRRSYKFLRH